MPVLSESNRLGDVLKYEAPNLYSREAVTSAPWGLRPSRSQTIWLVTPSSVTWS